MSQLQEVFVQLVAQFGFGTLAVVLVGLGLLLVVAIVLKPKAQPEPQYSMRLQKGTTHSQYYRAEEWGVEGVADETRKKFNRRSSK